MDDKQSGTIEPTSTSDLMGTIGFGVLIAGGGLPCILIPKNTEQDKALVILGVIAFVFGAVWVFRTVRRWRTEHALGPVSATFLGVEGATVRFRIAFTPTRKIHIDKLDALLVGLRRHGSSLTSEGTATRELELRQTLAPDEAFAKDIDFELDPEALERFRDRSRGAVWQVNFLVRCAGLQKRRFEFPISI